jgi:lysophospholipid acyltransferase (LPLAT)-like uncharacterized protein
VTRFDRVQVALGAVLIRGILAVLGATWRWRVVGGNERLERILETGAGGASRPRILAYWHRHSALIVPFATRLVSQGLPLAVLTSLSRDGELAAKLGRPRGFTVVRGSASRGGTAGLRHLFRHLRKGGGCILAPDGPRGPIHRVKAGVVVLSQMAAAPVVPLGAAADRCWHLRSWDRMEIPKPFARVTLVVGEPETISADTELTDGQARIAARLNSVDEEADRAVGSP